MELTGAHVVASAWIVALAVTLSLAAGRHKLVPALTTGPLLGALWIGFAAGENTVTREDQMVLIVACVLGSSLGVAPVAYIRWVRRVFRDENQRVRLTS